jgi:competence protein ComFC
MCLYLLPEYCKDSLKVIEGEPMNVIKVHPQELVGKWKKGVALDLHTLGSTPTGLNEQGHMQFDTKRPEIAELLFRLKYRNERSGLDQIAEAAALHIKSTFDLLVPVPSSSGNTVVLMLAKAIGARLKLTVVQCISTTRPSPQLKNVDDPAERAKLLDGLYTADPAVVSGKRILLFDDLYRSGSTLNAITTALLERGNATSVSVLTITKARSKR